MRTIVSAFLVTLALCACDSTSKSGSSAPAPAKDPERIIKLDTFGLRKAGEPSLNGSEGITGVELGQGEAFVAELMFKAGTGYAWTARGFDPEIVKLEQSNTSMAAGNDKPGSPMLATMTFRWVKPGKTKIIFELRRPWENDVAPIESRYTVIYNR
jgi:predicted secreted protein